MTDPNPNAPEEAHSIAALAPGKTVGAERYLLKKVLGQGGMGVVWLAHDMRLRELTALKFLPPEVAADPAAVEDLRRETLRSRKLSHPNIVRIHDLWETKDEPTFISMEYVDGPNLHYLRAHRPSKVLSWKFLLPLVRQLCEALDYAHGERVLHRDLKPANLMLDGNGRLKLADFGVACVLHDSTTRASGRTATHGTLAYMSPQQANGDQPAITDDIYAIGATVYELMTSQAPFHSGDIGYQVRHNRPQYMHERLADLELSNDIPSEVSAMVMACLAKEPGQRPPSARAILDWLNSTDFSKKSPELFVPPPMPAPAAPVVQAKVEPPPARVPEPPEPKPEPQIEENETVAQTTPSIEETLLTSAAPDLPEPGPPRPSQARWVLAFGTAVALLSLAVSGLVFYLFHKAKGNSEATSAQAAKSKGEEQFQSLFNGKDLTGWMGAFKFWTVEDGAIVAEFTQRTGLQHGTFLVWQGGEVGDFELRFSFRGQGNAGVKYRSKTDTQGNLTGYFAPFSKKKAGSILYTGRYSSVRELSGTDASTALHPSGEWNEYRIVARGRIITHEINGAVVSKASDDDPLYRSSGLLAFELDGGAKQPPYKLRFKDIRLKKLE